MSDPADFDSLTDPQIGALLTLCYGAVIANVPLDAGSPDVMIKSVAGWPVPRAQLSAEMLPILMIYRREESPVQRTTVHSDARVTFVFEYVMPTATDQRAELRWPALQAVWHELSRVVAAGHDPSVAADALILRTAGFIDIDLTDRGRRVLYTQPDPARDIMPSFVGTMILTTRDTYDLSALQDLVDLDAQLRLERPDAATAPSDELLAEGEQPLVEQILPVT